MNELDMSAPSSELFPEAASTQYNSYTDENVAGHAVDDLFNPGVNQSLDAAGQGPLSEQQNNFRALRDEVSKMKEEREYWKGQAEAYSKIPNRQPESAQASQQDAYSALDWDDSRDVRKAFEAVRGENQALRHEMKDALTALQTKTNRQDWNTMVTQHVPQLTSKNPIFAEMIQNASNPYEAAYLLAELNAKASHTTPQAQQQQSNGQRAMQNAYKPQSLASVGGQGQLSGADYYASMSDEDFHKIAGRNLANI